MDMISSNATELQHYGQRLALRANHAIQTFVDVEESDGYDSDDSRRKRLAGTKTLSLIIDQAGRCAATLQTVADEAGSLLFRDDDDESLSSYDERPKRRTRKTRKKKRASEAKPQDGIMDSVSISSVESDGSGSWSSASSHDSAQDAHLAKLRRRRKLYLRRRAIELAAGAESENEDASSIHVGGRLTLNNEPWNYPSQELRMKASPGKSVDDSAGAVLVPDLVNISDDDSLLDTTNEDGLPKLKWQSQEKLIHLSSSPLFLKSSHLGHEVTRAPCESMAEAGLQLGDIIIRLNSEDVSNLDCNTVSEMLAAGGTLRVAYLRKNMVL